MNEECKKCTWEFGMCDYCPHSSSGRLNLNASIGSKLEKINKEDDNE